MKNHSKIVSGVQKWGPGPKNRPPDRKIGQKMGKNTPKSGDCGQKGSKMTPKMGSGTPLRKKTRFLTKKSTEKLALAAEQAENFWHVSGSTL